MSNTEQSLVPSKEVLDLNSDHSQIFRDGQSPKPTDIFIAVMGVTGSGKSSFISSCSEKDVKIGHDLNACTSTVNVYPYELSPGRTAYLIDTPGFDDTNRSDTEVLSTIATWLGDSYKNKILLHGIIYLHRISDIRMQGSAKRNLLTFKELCGEKALKKVILATTMWDKVTEEEGSRREKELQERSEFWGWMLSKGSSYHRLDGTAESKRKIIQLLADHGEPVATDIQTQLVDEQRRLDETSAGREVQSELFREREKWEREREEVKTEVEKAIQQKDLDAQEALEEERERFTEMIKKVEENTAMLRSTLEELIARRDKKLAAIETWMYEKENPHEKEIKRLEAGPASVEQEKAIMEPQASQLTTVSNELNLPLQAKPVENPPRSPFSVSLYGQRCILTSRDSRFKTGQYPPDNLAWRRRESASLGDKGTCIAGYCGGAWRNNKKFTTHYPELGTKIYSRGLNNLDVCFLGSDHRYFARWQDGSTSNYASQELKAQFRKFGAQIVAVAFGYQGSCIFSYGTDLSSLSHFQELNGCYPKLQRLIKEKEGLSIIAIALDPEWTKDYIIIYKLSGIYHIDWEFSVPFSKISGAIRDWWSLTGQIRDGSEDE